MSPRAPRARRLRTSSRSSSGKGLESAPGSFRKSGAEGRAADLRLLVAAYFRVAVLPLVALAVLVVPVELAGGLALGELVRAVAERQILRKAAGADPLRFRAGLHFVGMVAVALHDPSHKGLLGFIRIIDSGLTARVPVFA